MNKKLTLLGMVGGIICLLLFGGAAVLTYETVNYPDHVSAATTTTVTVTASVEETISCSTASSATAFGTLTSGAVSTSTPNTTTTMSCANVGGGCDLYVKDAGSGAAPGLSTSSPAYLIPSANAADDSTTTLSAGTEGYGIKATSTSAAGSGGLLDIVGRYRLEVTNDDIAGLEITNQLIASSTGATSSDRFITTTHKAAIQASTQAGAYEDTITYECSAS